MSNNTNASWPLKPLSEVVDLNPRLDKSVYRDDLEVSFVPMATVEAGSGRMEVSQTKHFSTVKKGYTPFKESDVLFAKITPCMENGKMAVVPKLTNGLGFGSTEFHILRPRQGIDPHYVYYFVSSQNFRREAAHRMIGAVGQKRVPQSFLEEALIPVPLFDDQKSIVAEIEKQFSRLDEAVANLKRVKANLKRYKAAVLKAAVEGRLLGDSCGAVTGRDWATKPINIAIDSIDQGWSPQCENEPSDRPSVWGVIKTTAVQSMRYLESENKRLPKTLEPRLHLELAAGDLLMTRAGPRARVGVSCLVKATRPRLMLCDKVYKIRFKQNLANPGFLELVLNSPNIVDELNQLKTGINDSGVNLTQKRLRGLVVPLPSLKVQGLVVAEVERRLSVIEELDVAVDANLTRIDRLRQSILSKAFSGALTRRLSNAS